MLRRNSSTSSVSSSDGRRVHHNTVTPTTTGYHHGHAAPTAATGTGAVAAAAAAAAANHNHGTVPVTTTHTNNLHTTRTGTATPVIVTDNHHHHHNNTHTKAHVAHPTTTTTAATTTTKATPAKKEHSRGKCIKCLMCLLCLALVGLILGVLLWRFLPDDEKDLIKDNVPRVNVPDGPPPESDFTFNQCEENSDKPCCNGLHNTCDLPANRIMYAASHNAMSTAQNGFRVSPNHIYSLNYALERGFRAFSLDVGVCDGNLVFKHGDCRLGTVDIVETVESINEFLEENPNEVLFITIEINEAGGAVDLEELNSKFEMVSGFTDKLATAPTDGTDWATLGEMIESDERVMLFVYNTAERCNGSNCPAGFNDYFTYTAEGNFEFQTVDEIEDTENACAITRGPGGKASFYVISIFTKVPSESTAEETNDAEFLTNQIDACTEQIGQNVNMAFIDFWHEGDAIAVVQKYNSEMQSEVNASTTEQSEASNNGGRRFLRSMLN